MKINIKIITINAMIISIFFLFTFIPWLGYIPIGIFKITLMPILFLIGMTLLTLTIKTNLIFSGLFYGLLFGISSLLQALLFPNITSFIFINPLFSIVPRVLMGFITGIIAYLINKIKINLISKNIFLAIIATSLNTFFVLLFIYSLGPIIYTNLENKDLFTIFSWIILLTNYLPELLITTIIFCPIAAALKRIY